MIVEKSKLIEKKNWLLWRNVTIKALREDESHKHLEQDEIIGNVGPINKERDVAECKKHIEKIWKSDLSSYYKYIANNTFAVPVPITMFGLSNWAIDEINQIVI